MSAVSMSFALLAAVMISALSLLARASPRRIEGVTKPTPPIGVNSAVSWLYFMAAGHAAGACPRRKDIDRKFLNGPMSHCLSGGT